MGPEPLRLSRYFATVLQRHREAKGFSRQGLAESAGLHQTAVGLIERGLRAPNLDTLFALANALQTEAWQLVREAEAELQRSSSDRNIESVRTRKVVRKARSLPKA